MVATKTSLGAEQSGYGRFTEASRGVEEKLGQMDNDQWDFSSIDRPVWDHTMKLLYEAERLGLRQLTEVSRVAMGRVGPMLLQLGDNDTCLPSLASI